MHRVFLFTIRIFSVFSVLACPSTSSGQEENTTPGSPELPIIEAAATDELKAREGEKIVVYGRTTTSEKSPSGTNFVVFEKADFRAVAFKSDLEPFGSDPPADAYAGKRITVTGVISIFRDLPQIKLTSPDQVRILEEGEVFPPVAEENGEGPGKTEVVAAADEPEPAKAVEPAKPREDPPVDWRKYFK